MSRTFTASFLFCSLLVLVSALEAQDSDSFGGFLDYPDAVIYELPTEYGAAAEISESLESGLAAPGDNPEGVIDGAGDIFYGLPAGYAEELIPVSPGSTLTFTSVFTAAVEFDVAPDAPAPPAILLPPGPVGTSSHLKPYDGAYNFATNNCHTYANNGVIGGEGKVGIVRCGGISGVDAGNHTFNYKVDPITEEAALVTFYNYGATCAMIVTTNNGAPNFDRSDPNLLQCLRQFCPAVEMEAGAWSFLPVGQLDDVPGYASCVRLAIHGHSGNLNANVDFTSPVRQELRRISCNSCCDNRVGNLTAWGYPAAQTSEYSNLCKANCNGIFGPLPADPEQSFIDGFLYMATGEFLELW